MRAVARGSRDPRAAHPGHAAPGGSHRGQGMRHLALALPPGTSPQPKLSMRELENVFYGQWPVTDHL
jgi:hypothetical protein